MLLPHPQATAERSTPEELQEHRTLLDAAERFPDCLEHLPSATAIINRHRQVVYANSACALLLGRSDPRAVVGARLGEAARCRHATGARDGCGTTPFCAVCGAARAQCAALAGATSSEECRIIAASAGDDLDLRIWARPMRLRGEMFAMITLVDIADEKRRENLERIFFHDVLNSAGGVQGLAMLLADSGEQDRQALAATLSRLSEFLVEEIRAQRDLMAMERGEFAIQPARVAAADLLANMVETYQHHELSAARVLRVAPDSEPVILLTDATLLRRVLSNMTKNALEACGPRAVVTLACATRADRVVFTVHNPTDMPAAVQLQVFQRSFSTKGAGRGLGTYSMKLISERYLQGTVSFVSSSERGTVFAAEYPRVIAPGR